MLPDRFTEKFIGEPNSGCWLWTAGLNGLGYGQFHWGTRNQHVAAHRFSYEHSNGPIPAGACVLHKCDTPCCVNPHHLFLGSQLDNARDREKKGRCRGNGRKLSASQAAEVRDALGPQREVAAKFGISQAAVWYIRRRKRFSNDMADRSKAHSDIGEPTHLVSARSENDGRGRGEGDVSRT